MPKLRDPTTATGAFGHSIFHLKEDPEHGDKGAERAARVTGKAERTLYKYLDPDGSGPPTEVAKIIDELHRLDDGGEHDSKAWKERRRQRIAGTEGEDRTPDPSKLLEQINRIMEDATRALLANRGNIHEVLRNSQ